MENTSGKTIVFYTIDALGHIIPIIPIAKELRRRGHRVVILTSNKPANHDKLRLNGVETEFCLSQSAEADSSNEELVEKFIKPMMDLFRQGPIVAFKCGYSTEGILGRFVEEVAANHDVFEAKLRSLKPDLVICDHVIVVPCASTVPPKWVRFYSSFPSALYGGTNEDYVACYGPKPDERTPENRNFARETARGAREMIIRFAGEHGIARWHNDLDTAPESPYLNLYMGCKEMDPGSDESLKPLASIWLRLEHTIDCSDEDLHFQMPKELEGLPGKLIYFSLGTVVSSDVDLINRLLEILSHSNNKFVVSMGQMHEHIGLHPNMRGERFLNQRAILGKADLFITHAGHNSVVEGFFFGVGGFVALPVFADQFDCAQRIEDCGFGKRLNPFTCTQQELLGSIDALLANDELRTRMKTISARLRSIEYHKIAADKVEGVLSM